MKKAVFLILMAMLFSACAQSTVPVMPELKTEHAKECARDCQTTYSQCNMACSEMGLATRSKCLDNCNQILKDCYVTCE
jgi:hypothetical protein